MSIAALIEAVEAGTWLPDGYAEYPAFFPDWMGVRNAQSMTEAYLGSLDAAKALHEALLPGWGWDVASSDAAAVFKGNALHGPAELASSTTPARAWLLAILRAKEAGQ